MSLDDRGPHYYDQNGDGRITALDALVVINNLSRLGSAGEGETAGSIFAPPRTDPAALPMRDPHEFADRFRTEFTTPDKLVSRWTDHEVGSKAATDEVIDLLVEQQSAEDRESKWRAVDEAITLFS